MNHRRPLFPPSYYEKLKNYKPPKKIYFSGPYRRQEWSFPDSIIHYITQKPSTAKCYQNMIQCCKYFFAKNSILVFSNLRFFDTKWLIFNTFETLGIKIFDKKLWITDSITVTNDARGKPNLISSIVVPKLYKCDAKNLHLGNQIISYKDFCFLAANVEKIDVYEGIVKHEDGSAVGFEKLVEALPKLKFIFYIFDKLNVTKKTVDELVKLPHFSKIDTFVLMKIPEALDINALYAYMKKNKHTVFELDFDDSISAAYKAKLEAIIDETLEAKDRDYKPFFIQFPGLSREKLSELEDICR
uniref:DUF38 domain-containing protein n=1 Tax=Panagrolaimus sp. ES5 TaxID=591445 RepID=A0AC34G8G3_9BILA